MRGAAGKTVERHGGFRQRSMDGSLTDICGFALVPWSLPSIHILSPLVSSFTQESRGWQFEQVGRHEGECALATQHLSAHQGGKYSEHHIATGLVLALAPRLQPRVRP